MEAYCVSCTAIRKNIKNILQTKIRVFEKINKIDYCFYETVLLVTRKNQLL